MHHTTEVMPAMRLCLGGPMTREDGDAALRLIADPLRHLQRPRATLM